MSTRPLARLTALILIPVILLAGIAAFGLVEYRHAIAADARAEAETWAARSVSVNQGLFAAAELSHVVELYEEIPTPGASTSGVPQTVIEAWKAFGQSGDRADAERVARLAIHEQPSAISAPVVESLSDRFPDTSWQDEWALSEQRRGVLRGNAGAEGIVAGPALIHGGHVLLPDELRRVAESLISRESPPPWMAVDVVAAGDSLLSPVAERLASAGAPLRVEVGIGDRQALYARYRKLAGWVATLIVCALATAIIGIVLVNRTVQRERQLGELKGQFVASVSHELRAPVASMRLMADALDAGKVDGEAARNFHRLMSQEGARLSALIENVLDFARIEEGRKEYVFEEADLAGLTADTVALMRPVADERGVELRADLKPLENPTPIDAAAMQQALINLLDNAIKFTPENSTVTVMLDEDERGWQLSVSDEGEGVPEAERQRVFDRFTRLGNELRRETQGTGIGLSIVKHVVEAHGATVAAGDRDGGGADFTIRSNHPIECAS